MTFFEWVTVVTAVLIPVAFAGDYYMRKHLRKRRAKPPPPATHVQVACPICHDRIMVPTTSIASMGFMVRRDDLDIQAHMLTHPEAR